MNELFQFTIIDNDNVTTTIVEEPVGWDGVEFELVRLPTHGFANSINIDGITFEWRGSAKTILDTAYDNYGQEANVELKVEWRGHPSGTFAEVYRGLFKFNTYKLVTGLECYSVCGVAQGGFYYLFANRKNLPVSLRSLVAYDGITPLIPYTWIDNTINMPSKALKFENYMESRDSFNQFPNSPYDAGGGPNPPHKFAGFITLNYSLTSSSNTLQPLMQINDSIDFEQFIFVDKTNIPTTAKTIFDYFVDSGLTPSIILQENTGLNCSSDYFFNVDFKVDLQWAGLASNILITSQELKIVPVIFIQHKSGGTNAIYGTTQTLTNFNFGVITINDQLFNTSAIQLGLGDEVFIGIQILNYEATFGSACNEVNVAYSINSPNVCTLSVVNESICNLTPCKVTAINEALSRSVEIYTNDNFRVYSDYYGRSDAQPYTSMNDGCGGNRFLSLGTQIRNATDETGQSFPFKASFDYLYENLNKIDDIGYGVEDDTYRGGGYKMIRIEKSSYFYQDSEIMDVGYPNLVTTEVDKTGVYSGIKIGYSNWATEEDGGRQDIFAEREYGTNLTRVNNLLDLNSDFIASDFALEVTRRLYGLSKKDFRYDENTFIICAYRNDDTHELEIEEGQSVEGGITLVNNGSTLQIYSPETMKNVRITPVRNMLRWVPSLVRFLKPSISWYFKFLTGKANYVAQIDIDVPTCTLENDSIAEYTDIELGIYSDSDDGTPIMGLELISFEYPMDCNDWLGIVGFPYGHIRVRTPQQDVNGYIKSLNFNPVKGIGKFVLIKKY